MARRDGWEADRLEETCPRRTYRMDDAEFRDRVRRAHLIAMTVCLNMREGLAQLRMARAFRELSHWFDGPVVRLAEVALLWGRAYGHWEAGAVGEVATPDPEALAAEGAADPYLGQQLGGLREGLGEAMRRVADEVQGVVGIAHAADLLAQWEGFGRFCRDVLGVEPLVLTAAFGLGHDDPAALRDLAGLRVAVGPEGSGTRAIALRLLEANGVAAGGAPGDARILPLTGDAAAAALRAGAADAAVFVIPPGAPLLTSLLRDPGLRLLDFARHEAYAGRFPYLSAVRLPRGVIDLAADLPRADVRLVAPAANLVCRAELHPALVTLSARAATLAHERGDLLAAPGRFPTTAHVEWPVAPAAGEYFRSGPPLLQRYLPFWAASLLDRMKVLLLPLLTLALPLLRVAPPLYAWRVRSRVYRWYRVVQAVDERVRRRDAGRPAGTAPAEAKAAGDAGRGGDDSDLQVLRQLESELADVQVPLAYMSEYYNLRVHVDLFRRRLEGPQAPR